MSEETHTINLGSLGAHNVTAADVEEIDLDAADIRIDGLRLTEEDAQALAREIGRRHGLKGGRPALPDDQRASVQKAVRLTPARAARLAEVAKAKGVRESEIIRDALDAYLSAS